MPVLESVAASLRAMMPDLPMPVTMTRPVQACSRSTARGEVAVELRDQAEDRLRFGLEDAARQVDRIV